MSAVGPNEIREGCEGYKCDIPPKQEIDVDRYPIAGNDLDLYPKLKIDVDWYPIAGVIEIPRA